jgi:hypothetical protein
MKKYIITTLFTLIVIALNLDINAAVPSYPSQVSKTTDTATIIHSLPTKDKVITQLQIFSTMSAEKFGEMRGKKLNLLERWAYKFTQHNVKGLLKRNHYWDSPSTTVKILAFCAGFFFGSLALFIESSNGGRKNRIKIMKWMWFGFGTFLLPIIYYSINPLPFLCWLILLQLSCFLATLCLVKP